MQRICLARGEKHTIEIAQSPSPLPPDDLLERLKRGLRDKEDDIYRVIALMQKIAEEGDPGESRYYNYLGNGSTSVGHQIWELKIGDLRIPFYGTNGVGEFTEYTPNKYHRWRYASFDKYLRCTHSFIKKEPKTPRSEIDKADRIRKYDLQQDQS
ncbi:hypothetical protein ACUH88_07675 [Dermabacteraceae bacterium P13095]